MEFLSKKFSTHKEFIDEFTKYQESTYQVYVTRTSQLMNENDPLRNEFKYQKICYKCKHGDKPRTKTKDQSRPNQHSYYTDCKCFINLKFDKKLGALVVSEHSVEGHNHDVSKQAYQSYTTVKTKQLKNCKEAKTMLDTLITAQASVYHQAQAINDEYDLQLTSKDLHNYRSKTKPKGDQSEQLY